MKYFPLRDPISDAQMLPAGKNMDSIIVVLEIDGNVAGHVLVPIGHLPAFLGLISDPVPVAELDELFDERIAEWHTENYNKPHVVSDDGVLVHVSDIP